MSIVSRSRTKLDAAAEELRELAKEAGVGGRVFSATADVGNWAQAGSPMRSSTLPSHSHLPAQTGFQTQAHQAIQSMLSAAGAVRWKPCVPDSSARTRCPGCRSCLQRIKRMSVGRGAAHTQACSRH